MEPASTNDFNSFRRDILATLLKFKEDIAEMFTEQTKTLMAHVDDTVGAAKNDTRLLSQRKTPRTKRGERKFLFGYM